MRAVSADLAALIQRRFGPVAGWTPVAGATQARVWRVDTAAGRLAVKVGTPGTIGREHDTLAELARHGLLVPEVRLPHADRNDVLVTTWIEGAPADPEQPTVQRSAGRFLRALHEVPAEGDPMPWHEALRRRRTAWIERARGRVADIWLERFEAHFDDAAVEAVASVSASRVWCHRDYEATNWRIDADGGRFRVLDFGQARPDAWLADFVKLAESTWVDVPATRVAFFEGYGRTLDEPERDALERLGLLHGLQTLAWALDKGDDHLRRVGEDILTRRLGS